jgi:hypothetical protein
MLDITFSARSTAETLSLAFPEEGRPAVEEAAALLNGFVAPRGGRQVRRAYEVLPTLEDFPPGWAMQVADGQRPLCWAETRTGDRLAINSRTASVKSPGGKARTVDIGEVTSLELTLALTLRGCRLAIRTGGSTAVNEAIDFQYPQAPEFLAAFTALRQLLGQPLGNACNETSRKTAQ